MMANDSPFAAGERVFAYLRDSGGDEQDLSTAQQEQAITQWANERGIILARIYRDVARSGSSVVGRVALQELMSALRHGAAVAGVVVWRYSRFARNVDTAQFYRAEIRTLGYTFHSLMDAVPDGPVGRVFEALIDYKDSQYLLDLSMDTKRGLRSLVEQYGCIPGTPPRGFMRVPVSLPSRRDGSEHIAHRWEPDPTSAPKVLLAFQMRAAGASLAQIKNATGLYASINAYRDFFSNPLYKGVLRYGDDYINESYCAPIVPVDLWDAVQVIQGGYAHRVHLRSDKTHPRRVASKYLLTSLGRCGACGAPLYGHSAIQKNGKRVASYYCSRAYRNGECKKTRFPMHVLERGVVDALIENICSDDNLQSIYAAQSAAIAEQSAQANTHAAALRAEIDTRQTKIANITRALEDGHSPALTARLAELEREQQSARAELANLLENLPAAPEPIANPGALRAKLREQFTHAELSEKRALLSAFVSYVEVTRQGDSLHARIGYGYPSCGYIDEPPAGRGIYPHKPFVYLITFPL